MSTPHLAPLQIARQIQALADDDAIALKSRATFLNYLLDVVLDALNQVEPFEECSTLSARAVTGPHAGSTLWRMMMDRARRLKS